MPHPVDKFDNVTSGYDIFRYVTMLTATDANA